MHTNHEYPPRPVESEIVKCDPQKLKHCENTKANWGPGSSFPIITFQIDLLISTSYYFLQFIFYTL